MTSAPLADPLLDVDPGVAAVARAAKRSLEPLHAFIYFVPQAADRYTALGLKGGRMGYFASRGAPLGAVGPGPVAATFYNFAPALVARALPDAWALASPAAVLDARLAAAREVLTAGLADAGVSDADRDEAVASLADAASGLDFAGRPLAAAHADLPVPADPAGQLWHHLAVLREWRGDAHVAALLVAGLDPVESLVLHVALGGPSRPVLQATRGWSDADWDSAVSRLTGRGLLAADGAATEAGAAYREAVELRTDALSAAPWQRLGVERTERLRTLLRPAARLIAERSGLAVMAPAPAAPPA